MLSVSCDVIAEKTWSTDGGSKRDLRTFLVRTRAFAREV